MKITRTQLTQIIKEELDAAMEDGVPEGRRKDLLGRLTQFTRDGDLRKKVSTLVLLTLMDAKEFGIDKVRNVFIDKIKNSPEFLTKVAGEKPIPLEEGAHRFTVDNLRDLLNDTTGDKVIINNGDLVVYEHFVDTDGNLQLSVEPRR